METNSIYGNNALVQKKSDKTHHGKSDMESRIVEITVPVQRKVRKRVGRVRRLLSKFAQAVLLVVEPIHDFLVRHEESVALELVKSLVFCLVIILGTVVLYRFGQMERLLDENVRMATVLMQSIPAAGVVVLGLQVVGDWVKDLKSMKRMSKGKREL